MIFALGLALAGPSTIAAGGDHTCVIEADGSLKCWGKDRDDFLNEIPSGTFLDVDVEAGLGSRGFRVRRINTYGTRPVESLTEAQVQAASAAEGESH